MGQPLLGIIPSAYLHAQLADAQRLIQQCKKKAQTKPKATTHAAQQAVIDIAANTAKKQVEDLRRQLPAPAACTVGYKSVAPCSQVSPKHIIKELEACAEILRRCARKDSASFFTLHEDWLVPPGASYRPLDPKKTFRMQCFDLARAAFLTQQMYFSCSVDYLIVTCPRDTDAAVWCCDRPTMQGFFRMQAEMQEAQLSKLKISSDVEFLCDALRELNAHCRQSVGPWCFDSIWEEASKSPNQPDQPNQPNQPDQPDQQDSDSDLFAVAVDTIFHVEDAEYFLRKMVSLDFFQKKPMLFLKEKIESSLHCQGSLAQCEMWQYAFNGALFEGSQ